MIVFQENVDGYDVTIKTTEMYDKGWLSLDDDEPSSTITAKGKGKEIKAPVFGVVPKVITPNMIRHFLREEGL